MGGWGGARDRDVRERRWRSGGGGAGLAVPSASPPRLATPRSLAGLEMRLHLSAEDLALHLQDDSARAARLAGPAAGGQHLHKLLKFVTVRCEVGRVKSGIAMLGGPVDPAVDGDVATLGEPVLRAAAFRHAQDQLGMDISPCTQWGRVAEIHYQRPGPVGGVEVHETMVVFLVDAGPCVPDEEAWPAVWAQHCDVLRRKAEVEVKGAVDGRGGGSLVAAASPAGTQGVDADSKVPEDGKAHENGVAEDGAPANGAASGGAGDDSCTDASATAAPAPDGDAAPVQPNDNAAEGAMDTAVEDEKAPAAPSAVAGFVPPPLPAERAILLCGRRWSDGRQWRR